MHKDNSMPQLSLFSLPPKSNSESTTNHSNGNDNTANTSANSVRTGRTGEDTLWSSGSIQTGSASINDQQRNPDTHYPQSGGSLWRQNDSCDGRGIKRIPGEGAYLATNNSQVRSVNYSYSGHDTSKTFIKRFRLLGNTQAIQTLGRPKESKRSANALKRKALFCCLSFGGLKETLLDPLREANWLRPTDQTYCKPLPQFLESFKVLNSDNASLVQAAARSGMVPAISFYYTPLETIHSVYKPISYHEEDKSVVERVEAYKKERQSRQRLLETEEYKLSSKHRVKIN